MRMISVLLFGEILIIIRSEKSLLMWMPLPESSRMPSPAIWRSILLDDLRAALMESRLPASELKVYSAKLDAYSNSRSGLVKTLKTEYAKQINLNEKNFFQPLLDESGIRSFYLLKPNQAPRPFPRQVRWIRP